MERETMCIQAGYSPKNGESRMIPIIQSTLPVTSIPVFRTPPTIWWPPNSLPSKAAQPVC